jgi:hypothetical protein
LRTVSASAKACAEPVENFAIQAREPLSDPASPEPNRSGIADTSNRSLTVAARSRAVVQIRNYGIKIRLRLL